MTNIEVLKDVKATFIYYENDKFTFKTVYGTLEECTEKFKKLQKKHPNSTWIWQYVKW